MAQNADDKTIIVGNLTFTLPNDWSLQKQVSDSHVMISVPDAKYNVAIPMNVAKSNHKIDENDSLLKKTSSGGQIYMNACAPAVACYYLSYKSSEYEIIFEGPQSNEPAPANLDGPWLQKTTVAEADTLNFVATVK